MSPEVPSEIIETLRHHGVVDSSEEPPATPLTGGVSSDIWRVDLKSGPICVKRALSKLKVEQDWFAPVERNAFEVAWMETTRAILPTATPEIIMHDPGNGMFAMTYLNEETYPLWKTELAQGRVRPADARNVGTALGTIHRQSALAPGIPERFRTDDIFRAIRLEPYLLATAERHPDLADALRALSDVTAETHTALVHGDVSPKNILIGPNGPVFLDAECAWFGDPAFDVAFCLNHLLLKCLLAPTTKAKLAESFVALCEAYERETNGVADAGVMARTARLLPGLFLARIDGKSPVEYVTEDVDKEMVRRTARAFLTSPAEHPIEVSEGWQQALG